MDCIIPQVKQKLLFLTKDGVQPAKKFITTDGGKVVEKEPISPEIVQAVIGKSFLWKLIFSLIIYNKLNFSWRPKEV
jgi:hypothetical protein